jgi:UDP-glucuronate decarboxylase
LSLLSHPDCPATLYGDGSHTRSFCYVDDLILGFRKLMDGPDDLVGPVNLGNPGEFTMLQLAEIVRDLTGSKSSIVHKPLPADDPRQRRRDITIARQRLGWVPTVELKAGLIQTIAYFERLLSEEAA